MKGINGLRSHPVQDGNRPDTAKTAKPTRPRQGSRARSIDIQAAARPGTMQSVSSKTHGEPRDAKVDNVNSMRDLADFAKSTGPDGPHQEPKSIQPLMESAPAPRTMQASAGPIPKASPKASAGPKRSDSRLQARDAAIRGDQSSALIDFIREGPPRDPRDPSSGNHRIPRTVAPFRTTMDSDELTALGPASRDKDAITRSSVASTQEGSFVAKSVQSSSNSQTGLLESSNRANARQANGYTHQSAPKSNHAGRSQPPEPMAPVRKQRRVRDPYAIDTDDEEDEDEAPPSKRKAHGGEESLMDFLRNTSPTSESNGPRPLAVNRTAALPAPSPKAVKRNSSANALKDLITRNGSVGGSNKGAVAEGKTPPPASGGVAQAFQGSPRAVSPHLSRKGSPLDSYRPTQPTYAAHMDRNRSQGAKLKPGNQARSGGAGGDTADLADFLRNSGPPPSAQTYNPSPIKEESGFAKYFSRKKKVAA